MNGALAGITFSHKPFEIKKLFRTQENCARDESEFPNGNGMIQNCRLRVASPQPRVARRMTHRKRNYGRRNSCEPAKTPMTISVSLARSIS